jgi:hypothetical protein
MWERGVLVIKVGNLPEGVCYSGEAVGAIVRKCDGFSLRIGERAQ